MTMEGLLASSDGFFGWLWRASWQAAIVVVLVLLVQRVFARQLTPRWKHALWFLVVIRLVLPGSIESRMSLFNFFNPPSLSAISGPSETVMTSAVGNGRQGAPPSAVRKSISHFGAASLRWLWLTGAVVLLGHFLLSAWQLGRRIRRQRPVTNQAVLNLLEDCKEEMGVFTPLTLLETDAINSPALLGFVRPRLLLPEGLIKSFSLPELRFVFLHELGHLKRGDILVNWLIALPLVLHWFNPLVWYAFYRTRVDGESACDAVALSHAREGENQPYGQMIIKLLERSSTSAFAPGLVGILENKSQMKSRIGMIANFRKTHTWPVLAASLFILLALVTLTDAQLPQPTTAAQQQSAFQETTSRWRPWVIATSPRTGDTEVDPAITEITFKFDRDMSQAMCWTGGGRYSPPAVEGEQASWRDPRTYVLRVKLQAGHFYRVEINATDQQYFRGADGRAAAQSVLYFTTKGASDAVKARLTRPRVVSVSPANGATDVDPNLKELRVTFDIPMGKGYSWTGGGDGYPGSGGENPYWIDEYNCVLPVSLQPDRQYHLGINSVAAMNFQSAAGGVPSDPFEYGFRTRN